jgi:RNA polymerase-binding transcription factor DksA
MGSPSDFDEIRLELLRRRRTLVESHQGMKRELSALEQQEHDPEAEESAQTASAQYTLLELTESQRRELQSIDEALARLEIDAYGECFDCGSAIPVERMRVMPFSVLCAECAAFRESGRTASHHPSM